MCYSMSNKVVHTFQELQNHHCGEANIRSVLLQILAQRAGVTRQNKGEKRELASCRLITASSTSVLAHLITDSTPSLAVCSD